MQQVHNVSGGSIDPVFICHSSQVAYQTPFFVSFNNSIPFLSKEDLNYSNNEDSAVGWTLETLVARR